MNNLAVMLTTIQNTYISMQAFFYQRILQNSYNNTELSNTVIDWALLLPSSRTIISLNSSQVSSQIQAYVNLCQECISYVNSTLQTQTNLQIEQIQGTLLTSVTAINNFALQLLNAQKAQLIYYTTPVDMSLSIAMGMNGINFDTYLQQVRLNSVLSDMAYIPQGKKLTLSKASYNG